MMIVMCHSSCSVWARDHRRISSSLFLTKCYKRQLNQLGNFFQLFSHLSLPHQGSGTCRISPPRFLAQSRKRRLNQGTFVWLYFVLFAFWIVFSLCTVLFVSISQVIGHEDRSELTQILSGGRGGALNSAPNSNSCTCHWQPALMACWAVLALWWSPRSTHSSNLIILYLFSTSSKKIYFVNSDQ